MYVISKKDSDCLKKGEKYNILSIEPFEYKIELSKWRFSYIGKEDYSNFEYHL